MLEDTNTYQFLRDSYRISDLLKQTPWYAKWIILNACLEYFQTFEVKKSKDLVKLKSIFSDTE